MLSISFLFLLQLFGVGCRRRQRVCTLRDSVHEIQSDEREDYARSRKYRLKHQIASHNPGETRVLLLPRRHANPVHHAGRHHGSQEANEYFGEDFRLESFVEQHRLKIGNGSQTEKK